MYGKWSISGVEAALGYCTPEIAIAVAVGILGSAPILPAINRWLGQEMDRLQPRAATFAEALTGTVGVHAVVLLASLAWIAAGTYHPFIYFRF